MVERKIDFEERKERPQFAFAAVSKLIKNLGGNAFDSEMSANWKKIAGEYASDLAVKSLSKPDKDGGRILTLRVLVPAKITVLAYETDAIRDCVNKYYGRDVVKKVRLVR